MNWEIVVDIYALLCIKQITNKNIFILFMGTLRQGY